MVTHQESKRCLDFEAISTIPCTLLPSHQPHIWKSRVQETKLWSKFGKALEQSGARKGRFLWNARPLLVVCCYFR